MTQVAHDVIYFKQYSDNGLLEPIISQANTQIQYKQWKYVATLQFILIIHFLTVLFRQEPDRRFILGPALLVDCIPGSGLFCVHARVHASMQQHTNSQWRTDACGSQVGMGWPPCQSLTALCSWNEF